MYIEIKRFIFFFIKNQIIKKSVLRKSVFYEKRKISSRFQNFQIIQFVSILIIVKSRNFYPRSLLWPVKRLKKKEISKYIDFFAQRSIQLFSNLFLNSNQIQCAHSKINGLITYLLFFVFFLLGNEQREQF